MPSRPFGEEQNSNYPFWARSGRSVWVRDWSSEHMTECSVEWFDGVTSDLGDTATINDQYAQVMDALDNVGEQGYDINWIDITGTMMEAVREQERIQELLTYSLPSDPDLVRRRPRRRPRQGRGLCILRQARARCPTGCPCQSSTGQGGNTTLDGVSVVAQQVAALTRNLDELARRTHDDYADSYGEEF